MKLYLMTDCRNVSGLHFGGYGLPPWFDIPPLRQQAPRDRMAREVTAVVEACVAEGAGEVLVHEAHPVELWDLPDVCNILRGPTRLLLDETFDTLLFVGQHVNQEVAAVVERRGAGLVSLALNGQPTEELDLVARMAGDMGVPTALLTGEAEVIAEQKARLGAEAPVTAATDGEDYSGVAVAVAQALSAVREGRAPKVAPPEGLGYRLDVKFLTQFHADRFDRFEDVTKTGENACRVEKDTFAEVFEVYLRIGVVLDSTSVVLPRLDSRNEKAK